MDRDELYELYVNQRLPILEISKITGKHRNTITKYIDLYDLRSQLYKLPRRKASRFVRRRGRKPQALVGRAFGWLVVLEYRDNNNVLCRCECGKEISVNINELYSGNALSCGHVLIQRQLAKTSRKNNILITLNDKTQTLTEWVKELGVSYNRAYYRYKHGYTGEDIFL